VLTNYQRTGMGKNLLNFVAELYTSQTKMPFYIMTSNPQIIKGNIKGWIIARYGHASQGRSNTQINSELRNSLQELWTLNY